MKAALLIEVSAGQGTVLYLDGISVSFRWLQRRSTTFRS